MCIGHVEVSSSPALRSTDDRYIRPLSVTQDHRPLHKTTDRYIATRSYPPHYLPPPAIPSHPQPSPAIPSHPQPSPARRIPTWHPSKRVGVRRTGENRPGFLKSHFASTKRIRLSPLSLPSLSPCASVHADKLSLHAHAINPQSDTHAHTSQHVHVHAHTLHTRCTRSASDWPVRERATEGGEGRREEARNSVTTAFVLR